MFVLSIITSKNYILHLNIDINFADSQNNCLQDKLMCIEMVLFPLDFSFFNHRDFHCSFMILFQKVFILKMYSQANRYACSFSLCAFKRNF